MNTQPGLSVTEQRQSLRRELPIRAILTLAGATPMTVRTMDVGKNGISLIGITTHLATGQQVSVALEMFFRGKIRNIRASASVAHCVDTGDDGYKVGLQFLEFDSQGAALLTQYIEH